MEWLEARWKLASKLDGLGEEIEQFVSPLEIPAGEQEEHLHRLLQLQQIPVWQMDIVSSTRGQRKVILSLSEVCTVEASDAIVALIDLQQRCLCLGGLKNV